MVACRGRGNGATRHEAKRAANQARHKQEEKDPAPVNPINDQTAYGRADKKTKLVRHGHQSLGLSLRSLGHGLVAQGTAGRLNHRAADSLQESKQDQLENILRQAAEKRTDGHGGQAYAEQLVMAVQVPQAAANDAQSDPGHLIHDESPRNPEDVRSQSGRQRRHGDNKYPVRHTGRGNADYRIDESESA